MQQEYQTPRTAVPSAKGKGWKALLVSVMVLCGVAGTHAAFRALGWFAGAGGPTGTWSAMLVVPYTVVLGMYEFIMRRRAWKAALVTLIVSVLSTAVYLVTEMLIR